MLKLTMYKGVDPEDGTATYVATLHHPDTPEQIDCAAWGDDLDIPGDTTGLDLANDSEQVQIALAMGVYQLGKAQPIAHQFLAMPTTEQLWQIDVEGGRRQ